jgi:hypothetical protein
VCGLWRGKVDWHRGTTGKLWKSSNSNQNTALCVDSCTIYIVKPRWTGEAHELELG